MTPWTSPRNGEWTAQVKGRSLEIRGGAPTFYCYSDGRYLGSKGGRTEAEKLCESGKPEPYVFEKGNR